MAYHDALMVAQDILALEPSITEDVAPALALIDPKPGARILDFGCGAGAGVASLLSLGFDAHGVDIFEYWGKQSHLFWQRSLPSVDPTRLRVAAKPYRLPFPDNHFDHVISLQVIEHLDDRGAAFREMARVMKPGATGAHIFPGPLQPLVEGHINVPFAPLCRFRAYLAAAAVIGFRSARQVGLDWRSAYRSNVAQMQMTHYPSRRRVLREARAAGLNARFCSDDYVRRAGSGWTALYRRFGFIALIAGRVALQPMLGVSKPL